VDQSNSPQVIKAQVSIVYHRTSSINSRTSESFMLILLLLVVIVIEVVVVKVIVIEVVVLLSIIVIAL